MIASDADDDVTAGIITAEDAAGIRAAVAARQSVIQVDDFDPEYLTRSQQATEESETWRDNNPAGVAGQSL